MKSSRSRFPPVAEQKIPSVQTSPLWIDFADVRTFVNGVWPRFVVWARYGYQTALESPNGSLGFPSGVDPTLVVVAMYPTTTCPGFPASMAGKKCVPLLEFTWTGVPDPSVFPF